MGEIATFEFHIKSFLFTKFTDERILARDAGNITYSLKRIQKCIYVHFDFRCLKL